MAELELETTSIGSKMAFAIFLSIIFDMFGVCEILATFPIGFGVGFSPLAHLTPSSTLLFISSSFHFISQTKNWNGGKEREIEISKP